MMAKPRPCGCKGVRTCLICENVYGAAKRDFSIEKTEGNTYIYCPDCNKAWPGWDVQDIKLHPDHKGDPVEFPGILIQMDFISNEESKSLIEGINSMPWDVSQSGRRKQNFGPKCNFKKKKLNLGNFTGFPKFSKFVQDKFEQEPFLEGFRTIEQCSLEYNPERGSSIDPHVDDCWVWGERIVTVNVTGDSVLTMTQLALKDRARYNLPLAPLQYQQFCNDLCNIVVRIPMPSRSLILLFGAARYQWEHSILREDTTKYRVCLAYREFTSPYLENGTHFNELSQNILQRSKNFF